MVVKERDGDLMPRPGIKFGMDDAQGLEVCVLHAHGALGIAEALFEEKRPA
jgi:hypothetical protein